MDQPLSYSSGDYSEYPSSSCEESSQSSEEEVNISSSRVYMAATQLNCEALLFNKLDITPFFELDLPLVQVPYELLNEPYSYLDNKHRPEYLVQRPHFHFSINDRGTARCTVDTNTVEMRCQDKRTALDLPMKRVCRTSIVNVYDTYGLVVVYSFLKHLYYNKYDKIYSHWLDLYLRASLGVLRPATLLVEELLPVSSSSSSSDSESWTASEDEAILDSHILLTMSVLMLELMMIDNKQPKMLGTLTYPIGIEQSLPVELLSKIILSERVSRSLTATRTKQIIQS